MTVKEAVALIDNAKKILLSDDRSIFELDVTSDMQMSAFGSYRVERLVAYDGTGDSDFMKNFCLHIVMRPVVEEEGRA